MLQHPSPNIIGLRFPPTSFRLIRGIKCLDGIGIRLQVHLMQLHNFGPLQQLPSYVHDKHDRKFDVKAEESDYIERWAEAAPPLHQDQE